MKQLFSLSLFLLFVHTAVCAQQPYSWARPSSGSGEESAWDIVLDKQGNVYHTGYFTGTADFDPGVGVTNLTSNGMEDAYIAKYDKDGNFIWARSFGGAQGDMGLKVVTDDTGNLYFCGWFWGLVDFDPGVGVDTISAPNLGLFFTKYDSSGNYQWTKHLEGGGNCMPLLDVDGAGNIYVSGTLWGSVDFDPGPGTSIPNFTGGNMFFAKYDNSGNFIRAHKTGNNPQQIVGMHGFGLDGQANIYITGYFSASGPYDFDPGAGTANLYTMGLNQHDVFIAKYDSAGNYIWAKSLMDSTSMVDVATGLAVSETGDLFICGRFGGGDADFDPGPGVAMFSGGGGMFFARYDSAGNYVYAKPLYNATGPQYNVWMAADPAGNVYLAGRHKDTTDFDPGPGTYNLVADTVNIFYARYDASGQLDFAYSFGGLNPCSANAIAIDTVGNAYIAGDYTGTVDFDPSTATANLTALAGRDLVIAKYGDSIAPVKVLPLGRLQDIQIFPNPARDIITIVSDRKINEVRATNVMGQLLQATTGNKIDISNYTPGVYFLHISTSDGDFTRKVLKE